MLNRYVICVLLSVLFCGTALAADLGLRFTGQLPDRIGVADSVNFSWEMPDPYVEMRYGIKLPGFTYGSQPQWTEWGLANNVVYSGFVAQGKYILTVEARNPSGVTQKISHPFYVDYVPPAVFEEGVKIDRAKIRQAQTPVEKYAIAASEFEKAYHFWSEVYEARRRKLKASYDPEELVDLFNEITITELSPRLIEEFVDKGVGQAMGKLLLPKLVFDITTRAGKTAVLSVLSIHTSAAAVRTVYCYKMWKAAEKKAQTIAENNQSRAIISLSGDLPPFLLTQTKVLSRVELLESKKPFKFDGRFRIPCTIKGSASGHNYKIIIGNYGDITVVMDGRSWELSEQPLHGPDYAALYPVAMPVGTEFTRSKNLRECINYPFVFKLKILNGKTDESGSWYKEVVASGSILAK